MLPPFALGIFERLADEKLMVKYPELYQVSQNSTKYNKQTFWTMFLNSTIHSLLLFYIPAFALFGYGKIVSQLTRFH